MRIGIRYIRLYDNGTLVTTLRKFKLFRVFTFSSVKMPLMSGLAGRFHFSIIFFLLKGLEMDLSINC